MERGSDLALVLRTMGSTECGFFLPWAQLDCPDGTVTIPRRRQTVVIAADGTVTVSEPEVVGGGCPKQPTT